MFVVLTETFPVMSHTTSNDCKQFITGQSNTCRPSLYEGTGEFQSTLIHDETDDFILAFTPNREGPSSELSVLL